MTSSVIVNYKIAISVNVFKQLLLDVLCSLLHAHFSLYVSVDISGEIAC